MIPMCAVGMPSAFAKSGPSGITIMKSRMLTNWTAATRSTSLRSVSGGADETADCMEGARMAPSRRVRKTSRPKPRGDAEQLSPSMAGRALLGFAQEVIPMASISRETLILAPADHVWDALRDVGAIHLRL